MSDSQEDKKIPIVIPANKQREIDMFRLYLEGSTLEEIGRKYGIPKQTVHEYSKKNNWKGKVAKYYRKVYESILEPGIRKSAIRAYKIMDHYLSTVEAKIDENSNYYLTTDEMRELRQLFQVFQNENRLMDEKPTQNIQQKVTHELKLPPGVKYFGVDPPTGEVKNVEHKEVTNTDEFTDDDVDTLNER